MAANDHVRYNRIAKECGREVIRRIAEAGGEPSDILRAFEDMLATAVMTLAVDGREDEVLETVKHSLTRTIEFCKTIKAQNTTHH